MLQHYLSIFLRLVRKKPGFYLLNIGALGISIACFLMVFQYATYHFRFDNFHQFTEDTYRIVFNYQREGRDPYVGAAVFPRVGPALVEEFPEVMQQCRIVPVLDGGNFYHNDQYYPVEHIQYVDTSFFSLFGFELLLGKPKKVLTNTHTAVIRDRIAETLFPEQSPINEFISLQTIDGTAEYLISGVFKYQENTHLKSEVLLSFQSLLHLVGEEGNTNWSWFDYVTYIKLNQHANTEAVLEKFPAFIDKHGGDRLGSEVVSFSLQALEDIHLHSHLNQEISTNADYTTIIFLLIISLLVLVIAWINYINLYTAKAHERAKEVGIRKTNGSKKHHLIQQFMLEAGMMNLLSTTVGVLIAQAMAPSFETWLNINIAHDLFQDGSFWLALIGFWLVSTLISGFYPSLVLSGLPPLRALVAAKAKPSKISFRKAMVTWQFLASSGLIVLTLIVSDQLRFMNSQSLGIEVEDTYVAEVLDYERDMHRHLSSLRRIKNELLQMPGITSVSYSSDVPGKQVGWRGSSYRLDQNRNSQTRELILKMTVGPDFVNDFGLKLTAGRTYTSESDSLSVLINEEALPMYGFQSPEEALNTEIYFTGLDTLRVVGIVKNFHQESLKEAIKPTAYLLAPNDIKYLSIGVSPGAGLPDIAAVFETHLPNQQIEPILLAERMQSRHHEETVFLRVFNLFTFLAILLSVVGIVGLASYTISKKEKEIAIRKVLGSYVHSLVWRTLREFLALVLLANALLIPIAYFLAQEWLSGFAYHTTFNWGFPLLSLIMGGLLVVLFASSHVWNVAKKNPSQTLNREK